MKYPFLAAAALPFFLIGCGDTSGDKGSFTLGVTDAPVDTAAEVVVRFTSVEVHSSSGSTTKFTLDEPRDIDLLQLTGSKSTNLLENVQLDAGEYQWIRLGVQAENGVVDTYIRLTENGAQEELSIPSGDKSGLKLINGFTVAAGGNNSFTIDFDLRKGLTEANGKYKLGPALRLVDNTQVGSISGTVNSTSISAQCGGEYVADTATNHGAVYVYSGADVSPVDLQGTGTDPLTTAFVKFSDASYSYEAGFLEAGEYTITYTCGNAGDEPETAETLSYFGTTNVTVSADEKTTHNF
ncbi:DUF4382 domain-containing protein [Oceanospirillum sanctuarii]|uniref:DUF4382 domain-containing protein n=1 Tax=Oceanospirillum sanctuarii TaxID=1434821 RepID=UPI000A3662E0|nr:DUF4382 domain-containing protein [Oceanospirillum sanctuarii]